MTVETRPQGGPGRVHVSHSGVLHKASLLRDHNPGGRSHLEAGAALRLNKRWGLWYVPCTQPGMGTWPLLRSLQLLEMVGPVPASSCRQRDQGWWSGSSWGLGPEPRPAAAWPCGLRRTHLPIPGFSFPNCKMGLAGCTSENSAQGHSSPWGPLGLLLAIWELCGLILFPGELSLFPHL